MPKIIPVVLMVMFFLTGCAIINPLKPQQMLTNPLGTDSLKIGMTKEQVKSLLGEPDSVNTMESSKDVLKTQREEWTYQGRYADMPIKADYFGKTLILIFDGDNLTKYKNSN
jgi:outer membrane protein assembly factor BamE (lipoprotein component of BamABCDE complex)